MRNRSALILAMFCLFLAFPAFAQEKSIAQAGVSQPRAKDGRKVLSALDVLRVAAVSGPRLSPDASKVAYTVSETKTEKDKEWKTSNQIWVAPLQGGSPRQFTRSEKSSTAPEWSPDGKTLAFLSDREKDGERQVWMMMADGGEAWPVTSHKGGVGGFKFSPDGKQLLLSATDQSSKEEEDRKKVKDDTIVVDQDLKMTHLWLFNIESKTEKRLTEGNFTVADPQWSPDGGRITFTTRPTARGDDGSLTDVWLLTIASGEKKRIAGEPRSAENARWSPDGRWVAFTSSDRGPGPTASVLTVFPVDEGEARQVAPKFDLGVGTPVWSRDGKTIYFSTNKLEATELFSVDVATGTVKQHTTRGGAIGITDISSDGKTIVGTQGTGKSPAEIYRADSELKSINVITDHNAWLRDYSLADSEIVKWKSKDGTEVEGVLTKPVGYAAGKKAPFLLNPHGGPTSASINNFNSTVQVLAANGFAVLQPNFRGSTGKGLAFAQANKNTWGKGDYEDCMAGIDAMIANGIADPDKLGAYGWSYGGYMTFWILTQTDRFKAVSPGAGLTNIYSMYSQTDIHRYLNWFYSDKAPWQAMELYWDRSPMKYVNNVKTPVMIMHGQVDTRVPIAQAQEFYQAMREMNVPAEFVVYPRENHGFTEPRHIVDRVQRYVNFFNKYLVGTGATEAGKP